MNKIFSIFLIFVLIISGVFATNPSWNGANIEINPLIEKNTENVDIILSGSPIDMNYFCLSLTDSNINSTCISTNQATTIKLNEFNLTLVEGTNDLFAFLRNEDGNYSQKYQSDLNFTLDTTPPVIDANISDGNKFNIGNISVEIEATDTNSGLNTLRYKINSEDFNIINSGDTINLNLSEGTHELVIDANDNLGNQTTKEINFVIDLTKPIINSVSVIYDSGYTHTRHNEPTINFDVNDLTPTKIYLSCNDDFASSQKFSGDYSTSINNFNITSSDHGCNSSNGTKTYYAWVEDYFERVSERKTFTIKFDNIAPSNPTNLNADERNGEVYLTWNAASADNESGNKLYKVYRDNTEFTTTTNTNATVTGLTNNQSYTFKVTTIDNAGNESNGVTITATPSAYNASLNIRRDNQNVEYVKHNDLVEVICSFGETVSGARIRFRHYTGTSTGSAQTLGTIRNNTSNITEEITINSNNYDRINFWCEVDGTSVTSEKNIYVDDILPVITWPSDFNTIFSEQRTISVTVTDNRGVNRVEFELNGVTHSTSRSGNNYSTTINTNNIENGNRTLKAIAIDLAGNRAESSKTINISNTLTPMQEAEKLIIEVKTQRQVVTDLLNYLKNSGVLISEQIESEKTKADELLTKAESETNPEIKKENAESAKLIYQELINNTKVEDIDSKKISFSEEEIISGLINNNINHGLIEQIKERIINSNVERELNIMQIGDEFVAQIIITLDFNTTEDSFKVIEIIPQELVKSATLIKSNLEFNIIEDNPVIEFIVPRNTKQISYTVNNLSEEEVIKFSEENVLEKFNSPPIILEKSEDAKEVLTQPFNWLLVAGGILLVLIISGIIIIGVFFLSKDKSGFSNSNNKSITDKIKDILPKSNKEKTGPGKWKHKK